MSKITDFLKLHIWNIPEDNKERLNYMKSIADNFKKIDTGLQDAVSKFTEPLSYKGQVTTYNDLPKPSTSGAIYGVIDENKNYIWNSNINHYEPYAQEIDLTYLENNTKTTKTTEISEDLTVEDASPVGAKLSISGKTEQETSTTVNNILGLPNGYKNTVDNITLSIEDGIIKVNGSTTTRNTSFDIPIVPIKLKGNYTYSIIGEGYGCTSISFTLLNTDKENVGTYIGAKGDGTQRAAFLSNIDATVAYVRFWATANMTYDNCKFYYMINEELKAIPFEPFIPDMPSPDYPSLIRNVGDNIQLFDKSNVTNNSYLKGDGTIASSSSWVISDYMKLEGKEYNYSGLTNTGTTTYSAYYDKDKNFISSFKQEVGDNILIIPENACFIRFSINKYAKDEETFQFKKGLISTGYSKYGCGCVDLKVENKNKFNKDTVKEGYSISGTTGAISANAKRAVSDYILAKANTDYVLSNVVNTSICFYDKYKTFLSSTSKKAFTTPNSTAYIRFGINIENQSDYSKGQLEEGTVATDYVPHQEQNITFPLAQGQVLHGGDYLSYDGIYQKRKTLVLDGTEEIEYADLLGNVIRFSFKEKLSNFSILTEKCSHFKFLHSSGDDSEHFYIGPSGTIWLFISLLVVSSKEQLKLWLVEQYANGTPVTIEYELAKEIVTPYTEEQKEAYYQLQHLLMYEGYNHITCIDEIKPDMQLTYYFNNEINKTYGARFDGNERKINELEKREIYSTEEQVIGKWIDGKPLYKKVITGNTSSTGETILLTNIDNIIEVKGYIFIPGGISKIIGHYISSTVYNALELSGANHKVTLKTDSSLYNRPYSVALEYTKTADITSQSEVSN